MTGSDPKRVPATQQWTLADLGASGDCDHGHPMWGHCDQCYRWNPDDGDPPIAFAELGVAADILPRVPGANLLDADNIVDLYREVASSICLSRIEQLEDINEDCASTYSLAEYDEWAEGLVSLPPAVHEFMLRAAALAAIGALDGDLPERNVDRLARMLRPPEPRRPSVRTMADAPVAVCIGCGCDDLHACISQDTGLPCSWLRLDRPAGVGVCSACPELAEAWDRGERAPRKHGPVPDVQQTPAARARKAGRFPRSSPKKPKSGT